MDKKNSNKKGQTTIFIFVGLILILFYTIFIIVLGIVSGHINNALSQDVEIGQVNLGEINTQTFQIYNNLVQKNADFWGICVIFGMIFALFLTSYFTRNSVPKVAIIFEIFIIIAVFIVSLYLSAAYTSIVTAFSAAGEDFAVDNLRNTSYFIQNLPIFVAIIGVIMMILFHSSIPKKQEEMNLISNITT